MKLLPIKVDRMLSRRDLEVLRASLDYPPDTDEMDQVPMPMELGRTNFSNAYTCENRFLRQLDRVSKMDESALHAFNVNNATVGFSSIPGLLLGFV